MILDESRVFHSFFSFALSAKKLWPILYQNLLSLKKKRNENRDWVLWNSMTIRMIHMTMSDFDITNLIYAEIVMHFIRIIPPFPVCSLFSHFFWNDFWIV